MSDPRLILQAVADLREIGSDCQRGAFGPNLAERLWDIADAISEACEQRPTLRYRYPTVGSATVPHQEHADSPRRSAAPKTRRV